MITSINTFVMWDINVFKGETSSVTNNEFIEGRLLMVRNLLRKSLVSLTNDESL